MLLPMQDFLLISVRDPHDAMTAHEQACFERALGHPVDTLSAITGTLDASIFEERKALFFGGSGNYGVTDDLPWVKRFLDFLLLVVEHKFPSYASCFAFQGLALAMGGEISRDPAQQEMGVVDLTLTESGTEDPLFSQLPSLFRAPLGHNDQVHRLPSGVTLLAKGELVKNQAFRVDGAPFWASQFHPELTKAALMDRWVFYREEFTDAPEVIEKIDKRLRDAPPESDVGSLLRGLIEYVGA